MKQIQPISIWINGETKTANYLDLRIIADDLKSSAILYYELIYLDQPTIEEIRTKPFAAGNVVIEGTDYENWGTAIDVNTDAYNIAAAKLNLTLI